MFEDYYFDNPALQDALAAAGYYTDPARTPAVMPSTVQAEPVAGIGSPFVAAPAATPSVLETAAAPAAATGTGLQVVDANNWSPSNADLQAMTLTRDQWNEAMDSFSKLDLGNMNFGNYGVSNPDYTSNFKVFTAPKSNKGNPTSTVAKKDNTFNVIEGQPIRLVDQRTGKVVFQGTGYEAAEKAIEIAAGLTKSGGNKADWEIQTGQFKNPGSGDLQFGNDFKTVANEKKNTSFINKALDVLGDAALGFIIGGPVGAAIAATASVAGVNVSDIAYPMIAVAVLAPAGGFFAVAGAAALGSAVSSTVQGRSIEETLIRAGVTGLTAGVMEGTNIGAKVSDAIGGVLKDVGFESQVGNIISKATDVISGIGGEAATREIIVNAATNAATAALVAGATGSAVSSAIVDAVKAVVPDYQPSPETESALNTVDEVAAKANEIVVSGNLADTVLAGYNPIVETAAGVAGGFSGVGDLVNSPELQEKIAEEKASVEEPKEEIVVTARPDPVIPPASGTAGIGGTIPAVLPNDIVVDATTTTKPPPENTAGIGGAIPDVLPNDIVVDATKVVQPPPENTAGIGGAIPGIEDYLQSTEYQKKIDEEKALKEEEKKTTLEKIKDAANLVNAVTVLVPTIGGIVGGGGGGGTLPPDTTGLTFTTNLLRPTTPGTGIGGIGGRYPYTPTTYGRAGGDQETEYMFFTRDPVTGAPVVPVTAPATAPAGPPGKTFHPPGKKEGGEIDDDMVKHLVDYHKNGGHQGPGQVKGIGSGQEDKIPAYLSDGEYVWSAQDVSDLGDGSNREGVRRLDKMRQMVRSQAGRKDVKKIAKPQKGIDRMLKAVGGMA